MNALQYESSEDYYDSRLSREQLLARAIQEGNVPTELLEDFWECYALEHDVEPDERRANDYMLEYSTHYYELQDLI